MAEIFPLNLMLMLGGETSDKAILAHTCPVYTRPSTHQRCFLRSDRKTDCFDGGSGDVASSSGEFRRTVQKANGRELSKSEPAKTCPATFKTVCGTQTRLHGLQVKYRPDSQNYGAVRAVVAEHQSTRCKARAISCLEWVRLGSCPSAGTKNPRELRPAVPPFWQKPGTGVAAASPVPLRDADEEKEISTRAMAPMREKP